MIVERRIWSLGRSYPELLLHVVDYGRTVGSRAGTTREILDLRLELGYPPMCVVGREGFSRLFMDEEILQLLAGQYDARRLAAVVPRAADLITDATAYGPRVVAQLDAVEAELCANPTSRRAVVYVGRHDDLLQLANPIQAEARAHEMPCTALWQFHLRAGYLHMAVYMRSWDLVWGLSYDVPSFVAVQLALARSLGATIGRYTHTAGSAHVYERHFELVTWENDETLEIPYLGNTLAETRGNARQLMEADVHL